MNQGAHHEKSRQTKDALKVAIRDLEHHRIKLRKETVFSKFHFVAVTVLVCLVPISHLSLVLFVFWGMGILKSDLPAKELFKDFGLEARNASYRFYRYDLELDVDSNKLSTL